MDVRLGGQVVDLVRPVQPDQPDQPVQAPKVCHVTVVEEEARFALLARMTVLQMVDPRPVEAGGTPDHPVDLVALLQQQLGKVGAVLTGDPGHQRSLGHAATRLRATATISSIISGALAVRAQPG